MKLKTLRHLASSALTALILSTTFAHAADWSQWRGPNRDDISPEKGLLKAWPESGPKQLWVFKDAGLGYSGYSIVDGRLFTMGIRNGIEELIAVSIKDGKELWAVKIGEVLKNNWGDGPRATPTVDGDHVYAMSGRGNLVCAKVADGELVWEKMMRAFGGKTPDWGYTESVLIDGNKVVCTPGGDSGAVLALDKKTGDTIWQSKDFTDGAQYSSVIAVNHNGARQFIQLTMQHVVGLNAADGKTLWIVDFPGKVAVIPTPIFHGGQVYVTAGYGVGCLSFKVGANNAIIGLYTNKTMVNHHGGVILLDGHVYGHSDGGGWVCQDFKTGEKVWTEKSALGKGAVAYADGMLYCLAEKDGTVALVDASPKGWKEHSRFKLEPQTTQRNPQGRIWTHPVIVGGKLYLRDQELLHCYDVKAR